MMFVDDGGGRTGDAPEDVLLSMFPVQTGEDQDMLVTSSFVCFWIGSRYQFILIEHERTDMFL